MGIIPRGLLAIFLMAGAMALYTFNAYGQSGYIIQHYSNENGLPANGVKSIELDKENGFLWVGTQAGLVRFDGTHFKNFSDDKNSAVSRIALLAKNREGVIYSEDVNFSVYRINSNKPEFVMTDTVFYPFYQSRRWQTLYQSINHLKESLMRHQRAAFLPEWAVFHDESGDSSSFSFVHFGRGYHYNPREDSLFEFPGFNRVLKIGAGVYFVDSALCLWQYNDSLKEPVQARTKGMPDWRAKAGEAPRLLWKPGMKDPLFVWERNIWKLQGEGSTLELAPVCYTCSPPNATIVAAQIWEERGIIFIGSEVNGLYVVKTPFLRSIRADTTLEAGQAEYAQAEMAPGIIITTSGLSFSAQGQLLPGKSKPWFYRNTIYRDRQGDHWFNVGDTIVHLHQGGTGFTRIAVNDGSERMIFTEVGNRMFVFSDVAFGEIAGGQYRLLYKLPYAANELKNWLNPDAVVALKPGILAIATEKLILFDTEKRTVPDTILIPDLTAKVRALQRYGDYLLIGTYGQGFYMYKNGLVKKMPLDKNGYLNYTHCFMPDGKGFCWISTNHGLFKVSLHALVTAYENNLSEIYYHYLGKDDGMYNTELNGGCQPCALRLSSGLYSFPSMNGVVIFDPHQAHTPPPAGKVFIEEILADSKSCQPGDSSLHALTYSLRNLRFRVALSQFGNSENIYFSYKLEPYNDDWETQDILQNNTLQFGGLKPGNYTLYLRVRNGFEPNQFEVTMIRFRIMTPWYQSWWFYVLCSLGFIAMTWALVKWRTAWVTQRKEELQQQVALQTESIAAQSRQLESQLHQLESQQARLEEDNMIKARLIGIISHDMISPLKFMGYMGRKLRDAFPSADPAYHTAGSFVTVTQELESLTVNMLNWIKFHHASLQMKPEQFNVHELVDESVEIASTLAKEKGVPFYNDVPGDTMAFQYRQAIGVIVYNLAMNAMKYTQAGVIRINCTCTGQSLSLTVSDTGPGMPPELVARLNNGDDFVSGYPAGETRRYQFGYIIIKDLLRLVDGTLQVESTLHKGTRVTVKVSCPEN